MVYTTNITRINYLAASKMIAAAVARADEMNVNPKYTYICKVSKHVLEQF